MLTRYKHRSYHMLYAFRAALVLFGVYFAYHAFHGNHGLVAYAQVRADVVDLTEQRDALAARLAHLQTRVDALQSQQLDGDLIDERARSTLALIGEREVILRY